MLVVPRKGRVRRISAFCAADPQRSSAQMASSASLWMPGGCWRVLIAAVLATVRPGPGKVTTFASPASGTWFAASSARMRSAWLVRAAAASQPRRNPRRHAIEASGTIRPTVPPSVISTAAKAMASACRALIAFSAARATVTALRAMPMPTAVHAASRDLGPAPGVERSCCRCDSPSMCLSPPRPSGECRLIRKPASHTRGPDVINAHYTGACYEVKKYIDIEWAFNIIGIHKTALAGLLALMLRDFSY